MAYDDRPDNSIEPLVDGMVSLLSKNLVANTPLVRDAHIGDTSIYVSNTLRFDRKDKIVIMDNLSTHEPDTNVFTGVEFHTIRDYIHNVSRIILQEPLEKDFLVSDVGRIQKTIKGAILYQKDVLYGDREVIPFDQVAITVEPERLSADWMALRLMSNEYRMSINVYVKFGGAPEQEEMAMRICNAYATSIYNLLMHNLHVDLVLDEVVLTRDANKGDDFVYIPYSSRGDWIPDHCARYEVKDNFSAAQDLNIIDLDSWDSSSQSIDTSSVSSFSSSSSSVDLTSSSISSSSLISGSSSSSLDDQYKVYFDHPLNYSFKVGNKAVLRRIIRYMYDSRVADIEYGVVQKGSAILKAAKLTWWGKEVKHYGFPQIGKGDYLY